MICYPLRKIAADVKYADICPVSQPLSLVIITFNEAANIADCIRSVGELASEVLVLDSFSTDNTREIAASLGARVETHAFDGHIQQKNRAKKMASHQWVLSLDADERLSPELKHAIATALADPKHEGYAMNRLNFFCGRPIRSCGWYPDRKLRLWKKDAGNWGGVNPHDRFELEHGNAPGFLQGDLLHFTYASREAMELQVQKFADIAARQNQHKSFGYLWSKMMFSPLFKFIRTYILKQGFRDGRDGFFICRMQAREVFLKYQRAIRLKQNGTDSQA